MTRAFAAALCATAVAITSIPVQAQNNQPSGNALSSIFGCQAPGNRQGGSALLGAAAGGVLANQLSDDNKSRNTVLGALIGAAAGSYIGCRMQIGDQQRAEAAIQAALDQDRSQNWRNPQTGANGRVDIVDSYYYGQQNGYQQPQPVTINTVRYNQGVEIPREYLPSEGRYQASGVVNIRSGPSLRARVMGSLRAGETIDALVRVEGTDWVLAQRDGIALGYVSESNLRFLGEIPPPPRQQNQQSGQQRGGQQRGGQPCRTFDQTYTVPGGQAETQRYTACRNSAGEWLIQT